MSWILNVLVVLVGFVAFNAAPVLAQVQPPEVEWQKTFGGTNRDWGSAQPTQDGGYIIAGATDSFGAGRLDVYLVKTDAAGNKLWQQTYGGVNDDSGSSVQPTQDGGYIIGGVTSSFGAGVDLYLLKTDGLGNKLWQNWYGGANNDYGSSAQPTQDGGYIIGGTTSSFGAGGFDLYLVKTDDTGNKLWQQTYGGTERDHGTSVQPTQDGGYIIGGMTSSFGAGGFDLYLAKTDSLGNKLWQQTYGGANNDFGSSIQLTQDGGYIIGGTTWSFGAGFDDLYLVKTDAAGNLVWQQAYGGASFDEGSSVQPTQDGGYIIAGRTVSSATSDDVYLIKLGPDVEVEYPFVRGDASVDGRIDITDAIVTLNWLFVDSSIPICVDAADFDDGGEVDLSDPVAALNFLFLGMAPPKPPFPGVGFDPTPDELGCNLKRP